MTNEEAIEILTDCKQYGSSEPEKMRMEYKEALDLAIKALEEVQEWHKLKCICSNEGIYVYKEKNNDK